MNKPETETLFEQEKFILELLKQNFNKKEIAEKLNTSIHTIKSYITKLEKIGAWQDIFWQ